MKKLSAPIVLLCLVAFLLPILGGQIVTDHLGLDPSGVLSAILGGSETPLLTHTIFAALISVAVAIALIRRQILQVPSVTVGIGMIVFFGAMAVSVVYSDFKIPSLTAAVEWLVYGMGAFGATMCLGRREGARMFVRSLVAGCTVTAIIGIREFGAMRAADPGYRIFANWINPNALAGILLIGIFCALGLTVSGERREASLSGAATALQLLALWLTGSRAGLLAVLIGILVFTACCIIWRIGFLRKVRDEVTLALGAVLISLSIGGVIFALLVNFTNRPGGDQSAAFRVLLYKGAIELAKERPLGYGVGTYRFYSAKPGLTTSTQLTHDTYLQILVEAGPLALLALLVTLLAWILTMFRAPKTLPIEQNGLRAGVVGAIIATLAHGVFESNFYYFGIGLITFMLLGVGTLIAADGVAPEFMAKNFRWVGVAMASLFTLVLGYLGVAEMLRAESRFALAKSDIPTARSIAESVTGMLPGDGDALGLVAQTTPMPGGLGFALQAVDAAPSLVALRRVARLQMAGNDFVGASATLDRALALDPNNFSALTLLIEVKTSAHDDAGAKAAAERLIAVEDTPYYKTRSLPELIPTETLDARLFLVKNETDPGRKIELMRAAVDGFARYASTTVPPVIRAGEMGYGDETVPKAKEKVQRGLSAAQELKGLYGASGDTGVDDDVKALEGALEALNK